MVFMSLSHHTHCKLAFIIMQLHVQGLINLADNRAEDGGFHIVPGFHKVFSEWTERTRNRLGKEYTGKTVSNQHAPNVAFRNFS